jgi:two-component system, LuxR family, response regulator FixJ
MDLLVCDRRFGSGVDIREARVIAVVDDDAVLSQRASTFSGDAASGQNFLCSSQLGSSAWAILDLVMPDISGFEVQQLGARGLQIPIVLVSAHRDEELGQRTSARGALAVLRKPVEHEEFLRLVHEVLRDEWGR